MCWINPRIWKRIHEFFISLSTAKKMEWIKQRLKLLHCRPAGLFALMNLSIGFLELCSCLAFPGDLKEEKKQWIFGLLQCATKVKVFHVKKLNREWISVPEIRLIPSHCPTDQSLSLQIWDNGYGWDMDGIWDIWYQKWGSSIISYCQDRFQLIRVCLCRYGLQWLSKPIVPQCIVLGDLPCVHRSWGSNISASKKKGKAVFRMKTS